MKVKVYVLSFLREYSDDKPYWGVEGVFATEREACYKLRELYNDLVYDDPGHNEEDEDDDYEYEGDYPQHELRGWSAEALDDDYFGWNWQISEEEIELDSYQMPAGLIGSWVPSIEDIGSQGWDISNIDEETANSMLAKINDHMNDNDGVSEYYWNIVDYLAEDVFNLKKK